MEDRAGAIVKSRVRPRRRGNAWCGGVARPQELISLPDALAGADDPVWNRLWLTVRSDRLEFRVGCHVPGDQPGLHGRVDASS